MARYVGNKETEVVHKNEPASERCVEVNDIDLKNRVPFDTLIAAHNAGYKDCKICILETSR